MSLAATLPPPHAAPLPVSLHSPDGVNLKQQVPESCRISPPQNVSEQGNNLPPTHPITSDPLPFAFVGFHLTLRSRIYFCVFLFCAFLSLPVPPFFHGPGSQSIFPCLYERDSFLFIWVWVLFVCLFVCFLAMPGTNI